jgi:hemolysin-activating ACP:hemolysin acyltransferase
MINSLLIVGLVRNSEKKIAREVRRFERELRDIYSKISFFVVESDSDDQTVQQLKLLKRKNHSFDFISLGNLKSMFPERVSRLRYCRNVYVKYIREFIDPLTHILVIDFDIRNNKFSQKNYLKVIEFETEWQGIFANQTGKYFDIFPLRANNWSLGDCFEEFQILKKSMSAENAKQIAVWNKMRKIPCWERPIEVDSAFGGMAIYKPEVFTNWDYSSVTNEHNLASEHVALNSKIRQSGGRLFIHPMFTNFSWNPHNLLAFPALRRLDSLTRKEGLLTIRSIFRKILN